MTLFAVNLLQFALIAVAGLGVALTVTRPRLRAVSALLAMSAVWMVFNFLEETSGFRDVWLVTPAFRLAYPPLVYLVVRGVMIAGPALRWRDWPHALPFLAALALTPQIGLVEHAARISLFVYSAAALLLVRRFHQTTRDMRSDARTIQLNWMIAMIIVYIIDGVFDMVRMDALWLHPYWPWLGSPSAYVFQIAVSLVFVSILVVLAVRHARLFAGLEAGALAGRPGGPASRQGTDEAVGKTGDPIRDFQRVEAAVRDDALYTEPRLTRLEVATASGLSERAVTRAIKVATGRNFNDYINSLRIEDVCAMMRDDTRSGARRRVIDLAFTAGFSSKSVFNTVFKRETGQTPSAFTETIGGEVQGARSGPGPR